MTFNRSIRIQALLLTVSLLCGAGAVWTYQKMHAGYVAADSFRYFIDRYEAAEAVESGELLTDSYLNLIYGNDPELLGGIQRLLTGDAGAQTLQMRTISAILTTYQYDENDRVMQLAVRMFGERRMDTRQPGFHKDGYMQYMLDEDLWNCGNTVLAMLGRDIDLKTDKAYLPFQNGLTQSLFTGDLGYILAGIERPHYFILSVPSPRGLLPPELRPHVRSMVFKGRLEPEGGQMQAMLYCKNDRSARYTQSVLDGMKLGLEAILRSRYGGRVEKKAWGPQVDTWWSHQLVVTSEDMQIDQNENVVAMDSRFGRITVNTLLKAIERTGRDLEQMRLQLDQKLDPRLADALRENRQHGNYWSNPHRWGPNWPIPAQIDFDEYDKYLLEMGIDPSIIQAATLRPTNSIPSTASVGSI